MSTSTNPAPPAPHKSNSKTKTPDKPPEPDFLPIHVPNPTPQSILQKYTGTFRTSTTPAKSITISISNPIAPITTKSLYITYPIDLFGPVTLPAAPAPTTLATKKATAAPTTKTSLLNTACNALPQIRISGANREETSKNADLQPVGILHPEGKMVSFDVGEGEVRGVRVGREMFGRVVEGKGKEKEKEEEKKEKVVAVKKEVVAGKAKGKAKAVGGVKSGRVEKMGGVVKGKKK